MGFALPPIFQKLAGTLFSLTATPAARQSVRANAAGTAWELYTTSSFDSAGATFVAPTIAGGTGYAAYLVNATDEADGTASALYIYGDGSRRIYLGKSGHDCFLNTSHVSGWEGVPNGLQFKSGNDGGFQAVESSAVSLRSDSGDIMLAAAQPETSGSVTGYFTGIQADSFGSTKWDKRLRFRSYVKDTDAAGTTGKSGTDTAYVFDTKSSLSTLPLALFKNGGTTKAGINADGTLRTAAAVAATTPGSVAKKLQIFDASGTSLGYIPIYSSIT